MQSRVILLNKRFSKKFCSTHFSGYSYDVSEREGKRGKPDGPAAAQAASNEVCMSAGIIAISPAIQIFAAGVSGKKAGVKRLGASDTLRAITQAVAAGEFVNVAESGEQIPAVQFTIPNVGPGAAGTMIVLLSELPDLIESVRALIENPDAIGAQKEVADETGADTFNRTVKWDDKTATVSFMPAGGHGQGSADGWPLEYVAKLGSICVHALSLNIGGTVPAADPTFVRDYVPAELINRVKGLYTFDTSLHPAFADVQPAEPEIEVSADVSEPEIEPAADVSEPIIQAEPPAGKGPRRAGSRK